MEFKDGEILGVVIKDLKFFHDSRGWLSELFRHDELDKAIYPVMAYFSMTLPGVMRGPHAHKEQTDYFVFYSSAFKLMLWDSRADSPTCGNSNVIYAGADKPMYVIVPPGVVHAYKNVGKEGGIVVNFPNRLYAGWGKKEPVDEIRHEDDTNSIYKVD